MHVLNDISINIEFNFIIPHPYCNYYTFGKVHFKPTIQQNEFPTFYYYTLVHLNNKQILDFLNCY